MHNSLIASFILFITIVLNSNAQDIIGKWKTIDDETNEAKSVVEITERNGKVYGQIIKLFRAPNEDQDPLCSECPKDDIRYNRKVLGMDIILDMTPDEDGYSSGTILDPEEGKIYRCRLWVEGKKLKVRGYWGPFYRTQTWARYE
ncbi:MAG TPA: DUF2147 domain-containing protein [Cyclobacteriaceae bacterium]|nr:DUF2147 domain-containing protein [Cyclobacteriaceae bacterium]HRK55541.1 DUF2147 domain-containing protein [Cyclobacteriaceae bacterium]